ncbi:ATP bind 3 domain containing protein [Trichuris trichiura]|uniref:ATP bind 3 domain containing protein n=1 Tax=Trichuris trichiura TaxID=36087 RepID=A0A077Z103_TRITR|nr:ATP bind 3 domain containing protein [Trichuris trichiura]
MQCDKCASEPAAVRRPRGGALLCKSCFSNAFELDVHQTIVEENFFVPNDVVAIGVSGGKDSAVVLHLLDRLNNRFNYGLRLLMVAIDEGIRGYRDDSLESVYKQQKRYCLPLKILSYKDLFGWSMDEVVSRIGNRSSCTYCGVFRRQALERGCQFFGAGTFSNHLIFSLLIYLHQTNGTTAVVNFIEQ